MENEYLKFYTEHQISPVHVNLEEWEQHVKKRKNLYRQLGIPQLAVRGSEILEIGPGGGHNSLPLIIESGAKHIDLVEPNEVGRKELQQVFKQYGIAEDKYTIHPELLENFKADKKYDIIIAEGFLMCLKNWKECLEKLREFSTKNSIIIITCADELGLYVEQMKRLVSWYLIKDIKEYDEKVRVLEEQFERQLKYLPARSRSVKDWVQDQMLNKAYIIPNQMNMRDAMEVYRNEFDVLGSSQNIFTDYSWYKDMAYDFMTAYECQYEQKKHMFLLAGEYEEIVHSIEDNQKLEKIVRELNQLARQMEEEGNTDKGDEILKKLEELNACDVISERLKIFNEQLKEILLCLQSEQEIPWDKYQIYSQSFGKSMQYLSFVHR